MGIVVKKIAIPLVLMLVFVCQTNEPPIDNTVVLAEDEVVESVETIEPVEITVEVTNDSPVPVEPYFYLSDEERQIVENVVMGESCGEPYEGQILVAQCILNACLKDGIQPSEVRKKYKYSGWKTNPTDSVKEAVSAVFDDGYKITDEPILYFYAPKYCAGRWHETQRHIITVGGHKFFAEWS